MLKKIAPYLFYFLLFVLNLQLITDPDVGWHIAVGKYIAENKTFPKSDLFSFSLPSYPYVYHSWASYIAVFFSFKIIGLAGVSILYSTVLTLGIYFLTKTSLLLGTRISPYLLIGLSPLFTALAGARPRTFSFLFFSVLYFLFLKFIMEKSKLIYFIPVIFLLWTSFHASFFAGIAVFLLLILVSKKDKPKTLIAVFFASVLATVINPYGIRAWQQAVKMSVNSQPLSTINLDWKPLLSADSSGWIIAVIVIFTLFVSLLHKIKADFREKILAPIFLTFSFFTARFTVPLLVFYTPLLAKVANEIVIKLNKSRINKLPLQVAIVSALSVIILSSITNIAAIYLSNTSFERYAYFLIKRSPNKNSVQPLTAKETVLVTQRYKDKNILTDANWGGYLLLLEPDIKLFYWGAMDSYFIDNKSFAYEYLDIINTKENYLEKLEKYNAEVVFIPKQYQLAKNLRENSNWKQISENENSIIFEKN